MGRKIKKILSVIAVFCMVFVLSGSYGFCESEKSVICKAKDITNDLNERLELGEIIVFDLKNDNENAIKDSVKLKAKKDVVVGIGTDDPKQPASYYGMFEDDNKIIPIYIFGNGVDPSNAKKLVEEASTKFKINKANSIRNEKGVVAPATVSDNYNLVGSAIGVYSYNNGTNIYYQEYRWFTKGSNATTSFYALEKTWQAMDSQHKTYLKEYRSTWQKSGNTYQVDLTGPSPTQTNDTSSVTVSYPWGISYTANFDSPYDVKLSPDYANDVFTWRVVNETPIGVQNNMTNLTFVQGIYVESSVNNTLTRVDDNITTYIDPFGSYSRFCYTYIYGSNTGVGW